MFLQMKTVTVRSVLSRRVFDSRCMQQNEPEFASQVRSSKTRQFPGGFVEP